ncbi:MULTISPECIES: DJ-1/PfpI family protein [unclassified Streptomyces]|uniref:DJ-1/PfpI family protein n=1 Tax=unclassified Streptomyces TaxID=2593676 RepID=UPI00093EBFAC|nr:DJ-1/PfpI family protein [Streptomyces sp. TSRI0281]OKI38583.1 peptidase [Streptomyces sp. TSRI0281]
MAQKILLVTGDAAESLEVLYPYQRLREEGYEVDIAAPERKTLRFVVHDFEPGFDTYTEKPGYTWPADLAFSEVDPGAYVALVIPGGRAPEYLRNNTELRKIVSAFFDGGRPVAQICHGPLITAAAGGLSGRRVTAYPALEPDMQSAGATFQDAEAVVDGTLVSSRAWPDHSAWMREFLKVLRATSGAPSDPSDPSGA